MPKGFGLARAVPDRQRATPRSPRRPRPGPRSTMRCTAWIGPEPVRTCIASKWLTVYSSWRMRWARSATVRSSRLRDRVEPDGVRGNRDDEHGDRRSRDQRGQRLRRSDRRRHRSRSGGRGSPARCSAADPDCTSNRSSRSSARRSARCAASACSGGPNMRPTTLVGVDTRLPTSTSGASPSAVRAANVYGRTRSGRRRVGGTINAATRGRAEPDGDRGEHSKTVHAMLRLLGNTRGSSGSRPRRPRTTTPIAERPAPRSNVRTPPPDW